MMKNKRLMSCSLMAITMFLFFSSIANQPDFLFNQLSLEQRLPGASVHSVFQDHKGLMWFAIESVGLCKFDGENYTVYERSLNDSNSISNSFPLCIVEDKDGNIWVGTTEGLNKYDRERGIWHRYFHDPGSANCIPDNYITSLFVDRLGNLWISTREGASKYLPKDDKFCNFLLGEGEYTDGLPGWISCFYEDEIGNIWVGSYSSGLFLVDHVSNEEQTKNSQLKVEVDKHWFPIEENEPNNNYAIQQICRYDENTLLLGKVDGLHLFDLQTEEFSKFHVTVNRQLNNSTTSALLKDELGRIWIGYATKGLLLIKSDTNDQYFFDANNYNPKGIRSNSIRDIYEDESGLIWIATKFQGIHTYDKRQEVFTSHPYNKVLSNDLSNTFILSIIEDSKKNLWIGTKNNGLYMFNPSDRSIIQFSSQNKNPNLYINDNRIESIIEDTNGSIWIGTEKGINKKVGNKFIPVTDCDYFVRCLASDKNGNIWIGTNSSGVFYYDVNEGETIRYNSKSNYDFFDNNTFETRSVDIISDSLLWVSTFEKGLYKYNLIEDKLTHYLNDPGNTSSISGNMVRKVVRLQNGEIWIATKSNGLNIYNPQMDNFSKLSSINNLPPNTIYNILEDKNNNLWMGSHEGIFNMNSSGGNYVLYNTTYGLKNSIYEVNAACRTSDGVMLFGGSEGLNAFFPENVHKTIYNAPLLLTSLNVYDRIVDEDIDGGSDFSFDFSDKYISIGFALMDFSNPLQTRYKYKLENFDKDWVDNGNRNYATYTSLPPGNYVFKVTASKPDNVWMDQPLAIKLSIERPFWLKPSFIVACIVLLVVSILSLYMMRIRFVRRNEKRLKELVEVKTVDLLNLTGKLKEAKDKAEESDRLKSAFLANMSHEIRTPMNGILGFTDLLKEPSLSGEKQIEYIGIIQRSGARMLNIINDIIDISKIEAGLMSINNRESNINEQIRYVHAFFTPEIKRKGLKLLLELGLSDNEAVVMIDREKLFAIITNLVKNAIKFTNSGEIIIGYFLKSNRAQKEIEFYVKDTGVGIQKGRQKAIFQRFIQADIANKMAQQGAGLGLAIAKAYVNMMGGKIWVESELESGSTFFFIVPYILKAKETNIQGEKNMFKIEKTTNPEINKIKALIAEDDQSSEMLLTIFMEKFSKKIIKAKNGIDAIELCRENPDLDLILMDIQMPGINGFEATQNIRKFNKDVIIIAQTAYGLEGDRQKSIDSGCNDYISKPIDQEKLHALIYKHFGDNTQRAH